jgi:hypothetical protein
MANFKIVPSRNEHGASIFAVLVKQSYRIVQGLALQLVEPARPFLEVDQYWEDGDPTWSTVKLENELAPYKLATDVVVIGKAHAPGGAPVEQMDATVQVGRWSKTVRVFGDRLCIHRRDQTPLYTEPEPFTEMEIRYDRAYGGLDARSLAGIELHYPRNPMGTGFAISNTKEVVDGLRLPNVEDPNDLLVPERLLLGDPDDWNRQPLPQGFGYLHKTWYPRCSFVGAIPGYVDVDEVMREEELHWVPRRQIALSRAFKLPSFDVRFNNAASWGLILPQLVGDEAVVVEGMSESGICSFQLPDDAPGIALDIGSGMQQLQTVLHTVCVRLEQGEVDMIWRGAQEYPGVDWLPQMKALRAEVF